VTLAGRLSRWLALGVAFLTLAGGLASAAFTSRRLWVEFDERLQDKANGLMSLAEQYQGKIEFDFADQFMPEYSVREPREYYQLTSPEAGFAQASRSLGDLHLDPPAALGDSPLFLDTLLPDGRPGRAAWVRFAPQMEEEDDPFARGVLAERPEYSGGPVEAVLFVGRGTEEVRETIRDLVIGHTLTTLAVAVLAALLVRALVRRGLAPLGSIATQIERIDERSLEAGVELAPPDAGELQPIVARLNQTNRRLGQAFERERRFASDVAHELRTPIAELQGMADVGERWSNDPTTARQFLGNVGTVARRMDRLVSSLLELGRAEAHPTGGAAGERRAVPLARLVDDAVLLAGPLAESRRVAIEVDVPADRFETTDPERFAIVLSNLVDNAVEYAPEGSQVRIGAGGHADVAAQPGHRVVLEVSNPAPDLEPADLARLFERLWRKDVARADRRHAGLGLALARAVAHNLGYAIEARLGADRLLTMRLESPSGAADSRR
jgi:signal transduction histidine kinase